MKRLWFLSSTTSRLVLLLSLAATTSVALVSATQAGAKPTGARSVTRPGHAGGAFAFALRVPGAGDVSYAVARVRIVPGSRLRAPRLRRAATIFAARVGGLAIAARSRSWPGLRSTTRVYVVVSRVRGGSAALRDVAFFLVRRRTDAARLDAAGGKVVLTVGNAKAQTGSYWVRGVDAGGYADVFSVHDILSTAIANWSRYVVALKLAHAIVAATHPLNLARPQATSARAAAAGPRGQNPGPWTGGQRPSPLVLGMYRLLFAALRDPAKYAAVKQSPVVVYFIEHELNNHALALRWRSVVAQAPLKVPDRYAAAAKEEARFAKVAAPLMTHARVAIDDPFNSSDNGGLDLTGGFPSTQLVLTVVKAGTGTGTVTDAAGGFRAINCGLVCREDLAAFGIALARLTAKPDAGSTFSGWSGDRCGPVLTDPTCELIVFDNATVTVTATFTATKPTSFALTVINENTGYGGTGTVTSQPSGITCGGSCVASFPSATSVTLTATPSTNSYFDGWTNCDSVKGDTCTVSMDRARLVKALFGYP